MLRPLSKISRASGNIQRHFNSSSFDAHFFKQKPAASAYAPPPRSTTARQKLEKGNRGVYKEQEINKRPEKQREHNRHSEGTAATDAAHSAPSAYVHIAKRNEVGVQLLSRQLHSQLFRNVAFPAPPPPYIQIAKEHLEMHNLDPAQGSSHPDTSFRLPPLQGADLDEHFYRIGARAAEPWLQQAKTLSSIQLPPKPEHWEIRSGWTKYTYMPDGASYSEPVDFPVHDKKPEQMLVFDVETMPAHHPYAIMACAASSSAWYSWISPWLLEETKDPKHLIPLGDPRVPRIVVGHNISYDRARVLEEYNIEGTATRFLDTMALHVAVTGISSHQRPEWMKYRKSKATQVQQQEEAIEVMYDLIRSVEEREKDEMNAEKKEEMRRVREGMIESVTQLSEASGKVVEVESEVAVEKRWEELTSANSLVDVAKLHCGISLDKGIRNDFMTSTPQDVRDNIHDYLDYCCSDVEVTHRVYTVVLPSFLQACVHPVTFAGVLEMGSSFLTVNREWEYYLERAEGIYRQIEEGIKQKLKQLAEGARQLASEPEKWKEDPWLSQLDWTPKVAGKSRGIVVESQTTCSADAGGTPKRRRTPKPKPVKPPPIYWPKWYWDAAKPSKGVPPGTLHITVRNRIAPILLRLSWLGWPLFHSREHGWTFRVPLDGTHTTRTTPLTFYDAADNTLAEMSLQGGYRFFKLPHKDGEKANVGSPLGKTFVKYAQDGTLQSPGEEAKEALDMNAQCSYWISARDRIMNQMVVWQDGHKSLGLSNSYFEGDEERWGVILPQVITMGAVTRRAIEKTWLTASNAKKNRVGSELKAMVRAPEGYAIVGADVDSEELWISSCMGDAQFGLHGATALGWMTLEGTKAAGTDLHSKTASILGISRDAAKVFNYSRIYGAGQRHAILLLLQSNPSMEPEQAQKLAQSLYASTKGKNTHRSDMFERKFWFGGSESFVFNKLEEIALSDNPRTPALGCSITHALSKKHLPATFGSDYMTSRINWAVQSSGVDYLHLLIVSMQHLITKYNIEARYLISVHDELRYLVKKEDRYRAALALQIANLWTRSLFAYKLGMDDLPQGVAFFSAVDVDHVLRKEVDMPCVTPSHPDPIAPGESLDITKVLEKTNGGTLMKNGSPMSNEQPSPEEYEGNLDGYVRPDCLVHRSTSAAFLRAQATADLAEIKGLAQKVYGKKFRGSGLRVKKKKVLLGNGECIDWSETVERLLRL